MKGMEASKSLEDRTRWARAVDVNQRRGLSSEIELFTPKYDYSPFSGHPVLDIHDRHMSEKEFAQRTDQLRRGGLGEFLRIQCFMSDFEVFINRRSDLRLISARSDSYEPGLLPLLLTYLADHRRHPIRLHFDPGAERSQDLSLVRSTT
jgi:hypothetical protein